MRLAFAGPTLAGKLDEIRRQDPDLVIAAPAVWGDVAKAVISGANVIGIIDGCFEQTRAVWHKEILYALSKGVVVAGAASMGALRAAECEPFGMIGIGQIYKRYATGELTDDSDVALVHCPGDLDYMALSEPRVNLMATLELMRDAGVLLPDEYKVTRLVAQRLHYSELSHAAVINAAGIADPERARRLISWADRHHVNVKEQDALALIEWIGSCPDALAKEPGWKFSESSQWTAMTRELESA